MTTVLSCWKCHRIQDNLSKITFRTACSYCGIDLHTCTNCRYYALGKPNDCLVPGTETIRDRETANFCEDFSIKPPRDNSSPLEDLIAKAKKRLFGE